MPNEAQYASLDWSLKAKQRAWDIPHLQYQHVLAKYGDKNDMYAIAPPPPPFNFILIQYRQNTAVMKDSLYIVYREIVMAL